MSPPSQACLVDLIKGQGLFLKGRYWVVRCRKGAIWVDYWVIHMEGQLSSLGSNHGNKQPLQAASMTTFALPWVPSAMIGQTLRILQKSWWSSNAKTNLNLAKSGFWTVGSALLACSQTTHNSQKNAQILHRYNFLTSSGPHVGRVSLNQDTCWLSLKHGTSRCLEV